MKLPFKRLISLFAGTALAAMGASGRAFVEGWVSPAAVGAAYEQLFESVRADRLRAGA